MYINNSLADYIGGNKLMKSYGEIITAQPEEKRTADEIIYSITSRLNGTTNVQSI